MQDLLIYILYFRAKYTLNGFALLFNPLFFINRIGGKNSFNMNTIITAAFESFENADKALGEICRIDSHIHCVETTAQNTKGLDSPPFVVPIAPDYFRIYPTANNNSCKEHFNLPTLNIVANSKYRTKIEKVIRRFGGNIGNSADVAH